MTKIYEKFGIETESLDVVKNDLEEILKIKFDEHESSYWDVYYLAKLGEETNLKIVKNFVDDDWQEEDHKDCPLLLEINKSKEEIFDLLLGSSLPYLKHLYRSEIEPKKTSKKYKIVNGEFVLISERKLRDPFVRKQE